MFEIYINHPNEMEMRTIPSVGLPKDHEVKIKPIYGGICGSDLRVYKGSVNYASYPVRTGHELIGTIVEKGRDVSYDLGTRVVVYPNTFCAQCDYCLVGKTNICRHKKSLGINMDGGFAEQFLISSQFVLPVPSDISDERAVLIEPLAVVVHALKKVTITDKTTVAIVGCGTEGMLAATLAVHLGASVTAIDINPSKLNLVQSLGASIRTVLPQSVEGEVFDVVVEAAGVKASIEQGMRLVKPGGAMLLIGITNEAILPVPHVVRNEITLYGTIIYSFPDDFVISMDYLRDTSFQVDGIVSKIMPYSEYQQAFEHALSGDYGKIILNFKEEQTV